MWAIQSSQSASQKIDLPNHLFQLVINNWLVIILTFFLPPKQYISQSTRDTWHIRLSFSEAMSAERVISLARSDASQVWGFRLVGGANLGTPLIVQNVSRWSMRTLFLWYWLSAIIVLHKHYTSHATQCTRHFTQHALSIGNNWPIKNLCPHKKCHPHVLVKNFFSASTVEESSWLMLPLSVMMNSLLNVFDSKKHFTNTHTHTL